MPKKWLRFYNFLFVMYISYISATYVFDGPIAGEHEQSNGSSSSYITHQQQRTQQSHEVHEISSTDYSYSTTQLTMSSVDSTVPPIVSPTGEMIQPGPLSYKQTVSGTGMPWMLYQC